MNNLSYVTCRVGQTGADRSHGLKPKAAGLETAPAPRYGTESPTKYVTVFANGSIYTLAPETVDRALTG